MYGNVEIKVARSKGDVEVMALTPGVGYLAVIRREARGLAFDKLGFGPSMGALRSLVMAEPVLYLDCDAFGWVSLVEVDRKWLGCVVNDEEVMGVTVWDDMFEMYPGACDTSDLHALPVGHPSSRGGGTPGEVLAGAGGVVPPGRASMRLAGGAVVDVPEGWLKELDRCGGDVEDTGSSAPDESVLAVTQADEVFFSWMRQVVRGADDCVELGKPEEGFCYLELFDPVLWVALRARLGPGPALADVLPLFRLARELGLVPAGAVVTKAYGAGGAKWLHVERGSLGCKFDGDALVVHLEGLDPGSTVGVTPPNEGLDDLGVLRRMVKLLSTHDLDYIDGVLRDCESCQDSVAGGDVALASCVYNRLHRVLARSAQDPGGLRRSLVAKSFGLTSQLQGFETGQFVEGGTQGLDHVELVLRRLYSTLCGAGDAVDLALWQGEYNGPQVTTSSSCSDVTVGTVVEHGPGFVSLSARSVWSHARGRLEAGNKGLVMCVTEGLKLKLVESPVRARVAWFPRVGVVGTMWFGWNGRVPHPKSSQGRLLGSVEFAYLVYTGGEARSNPSLEPLHDVGDDWRAVDEWRLARAGAYDGVPEALSGLSCLLDSKGVGGVLRVGGYVCEGLPTVVGLWHACRPPISVGLMTGDDSIVYTVIADEYCYDDGGPSGSDFYDGY